MDNADKIHVSRSSVHAGESSVKAPVETRLTAEQFATEQCGWVVHDRKHQTATLEEVFEFAEAFRDKSESLEIESLRATNRELNRRCQALTHTINTNSDRKTWYGYYQAALSIAGWEEEKRKAAEAEAAALRERERWIPVEEKLPESRVWVQGLTEHDGRRAVAPLFGVRDSKSTRFRWECEFTVIAWKALSAAPERP